MSSGSVNFDRAVDYYDQTRREAPQTTAKVAALLRSELEGRGRVLEIGAGTGRIALELHALGIPMAGVDISAGMLGVLVGKAGGTPPFPIAVADATALPLRTGSLGAGVASHVFHLIPPWREAVADLIRVVVPGGVVLACLTSGGTDPLGVRSRFMDAAGTPRLHVGVQGFEELDAAFIAGGAMPRELPAVPERLEVAPEEVIGRLERGEFSYTWRMDDGLRHRAADRVREWARKEYGSLEEPRSVERAIIWRAYDLG
jgi:SAM-dependent methyltransferase